MSIFLLFFFLLLLLIGTAIYFIPTIVGVIRQVPNRAGLVLVNLFLGWTLVGWVVALVMALRAPEAGYDEVVVEPPPRPVPEAPPIYDTSELEAAADELPEDPFEDLG